MMKDTVKTMVRVISPPLIRDLSIAQWPGWLGRVHDIKVPHSLIPQRRPAPTGTANINILVRMIERTKALPGDIADCGVFRGGSTAGMGLYLRQHRIKKTIYGFDSFEGFDPESAAADMKLGGAENEDRHEHGFSATSMDEVMQKARRFHLNVVLVPGYFSQSLPTLPQSIRFCFAHLDVNLYDSYKQCLEFFYPRMVAGGVILLDEYNDPPWPGCNKAVDEFLHDKPERLRVAESDNYQKWYFAKL